MFICFQKLKSNDKDKDNDNDNDIDMYVYLEKDIKEQSQRLVNFETLDQSDEET